MSDTLNSLPTQILDMQKTAGGYKCPECHKPRGVKFGMKVTREGKKQRYQCQECGNLWYE